MLVNQTGRHGAVHGHYGAGLRLQVAIGGPPSPQTCQSTCRWSIGRHPIGGIRRVVPCSTLSAAAKRAQRETFLEVSSNTLVGTGEVCRRCAYADEDGVFWVCWWLLRLQAGFCGAMARNSPGHEAMCMIIVWPAREVAPCRPVRYASWAKVCLVAQQRTTRPSPDEH
jgi:hypothetical protein